MRWRARRGPVEPGPADRRGAAASGRSAGHGRLAPARRPGAAAGPQPEHHRDGGRAGSDRRPGNPAQPAGARPAGRCPSRPGRRTPGHGGVQPGLRPAGRPAHRDAAGPRAGHRPGRRPGAAGGCGRFGSTGCAVHRRQSAAGSSAAAGAGRHHGHRGFQPDRRLDRSPAVALVAWRQLGRTALGAAGDGPGLPAHLVAGLCRRCGQWRVAVDGDLHRAHEPLVAAIAAERQRPAVAPHLPGRTRGKAAALAPADPGLGAKARCSSAMPTACWRWRKPCPPRCARWCSTCGG